MAQVCEQKGYPCIFVGEHTISVCQPNKLVHDIFYDFLHVDEIPVKTFEEAVQEEIFQMTPFVTVEEETKYNLKFPIASPAVGSRLLQISRQKEIRSRKVSMK